MAKKYDFPMGFGLIDNKIVHNNGSVRPATEQEKSLWQRLLAIDPTIALDASNDTEG